LKERGLYDIMGWACNMNIGYICGLWRWDVACGLASNEQKAHGSGPFAVPRVEMLLISTIF
jgi:hypothetical protein